MTADTTRPHGELLAGRGDHAPDPGGTVQDPHHRGTGAQGHAVGAAAVLQRVHDRAHRPDRETGGAAERDPLGRVAGVGCARRGQGERAHHQSHGAAGRRGRHELGVQRQQGEQRLGLVRHETLVEQPGEAALEDGGEELVLLRVGQPLPEGGERGRRIVEGHPQARPEPFQTADQLPVTVGLARGEGVELPVDAGGVAPAQEAPAVELLDHGRVGPDEPETVVGEPEFMDDRRVQ